MSIHSHVATRKDHRCTACGRRIPIGARYFVDEDAVGDEPAREHTNCLEYQSEPELPAGYNQNRSLVK